MMSLGKQKCMPQNSHEFHELGSICVKTKNKNNLINLLSRAGSSSAIEQ